MSKAGSNGSSSFPNKISHYRVSGIPQRVWGTDRVLEQFSPCSTKLRVFWLEGQRKVIVICLHFHGVSQHSIVAQWGIPLGGWPWMITNTPSPVYPTEHARTLTGLWLLFRMNSESFLHTWHKGQRHLATGLHLMLMSVYSLIEWWHLRPAKRGTSVAKFLNILNMLLCE